MRSLPIFLALCLTAACTVPSAGPEPSLAPRPAEAIDPRVPIAAEAPAGTADPQLVAQLGKLSAEVDGAVAAFDARLAEAERAAAAAGPQASESWVVAQSALSHLVEQFGVTSRAAADIDALAAERLQQQKWITPADQAAITATQAHVATISDRQSGAIERLKDQLAR